MTLASETPLSLQDGSPHILRVNEVFHSFQGEGPSTGRAARTEVHALHEEADDVRREHCLAIEGIDP